MNGPASGQGCTCTGCPPRPTNILTHSWQERQWTEQRTFEPCTDSGCSCHCQEPATQEDMLCDLCRERGGISSLDGRRIAAFLPGPRAAAEVTGA